MKPTIFALATAPGRSAVAIVRVSGPAAGAVCQALTDAPPPPPRRASRRYLSAPETREVIDDALVLWFPAPRSVTDEDLPDDLGDRARATIAPLLDEMARHLAHGRAGERLRGGLDVAILGAPNVGKSSLLNALARRDAAIVSAHAGTTRDVIDVHLDLDGLPLTVADTAGLRDSGDEIEQEGVRRALDRTATADVKL